MKTDYTKTMTALTAYYYYRYCCCRCYYYVMFHLEKGFAAGLQQEH